jgi:glycerol kinase
MTHILAIDQGTTSSRAIAFDGNMKPAATAQKEFTQIFPHSGWVEHDPEEIWSSVLETAGEVVAKIGTNKISAIGITNQRETVVIWNRETGVPIYNAVVWQDRRTSDLCAALRENGHEALVTEHTGLLLDPYFSATKVKWLLENVSGAFDLAQAGKLAFGTIDSFLIWRLTGGTRHVTDATNAARTMLYDIRNGCWDVEICDLLEIPQSILPEVLDCAANFGITDASVFGAEIPILGVAGDQQAATIGQACFKPGMMKSTYGTGCFALLNTGNERVSSKSRLLTTIAYQLEGKPTYALEGSIFIAGAAVQWLRDGIGILSNASDAGSMARSADTEQSIYLVPAFTGLGAPYWDADCRGAIFGLTRNTGPEEFACAALQAVGFQTADLLSAMLADYPNQDRSVALRVDGGMAASNYTMQFLADITGAIVERPAVLETTAVGVAWLAGQRCGLYPNLEDFAAGWNCNNLFEPKMPDDHRLSKIAGWKDAVSRTLSSR